jgi:hypothetical protein
VNNALPGDTINVTGTCSENLFIANEKRRIAIDGGGTVALSAPGATSPAVTIRGKGITLHGFNITGGNSGVYVNRGSFAFLNNNVVQNAGGSGVIVDDLAFAVLTNNTIQNNAGTGVIVSESSDARIGFNFDTETAASANIIQNNDGGGIIVRNGSSARIIGNTITANAGDGVFVGRDSQADLASNVVSNNTGNGIRVSESSFLQLGEDTGATIYDQPNSGSGNAASGVTCTTGSVADGRIGTLAGSAGAKSFLDSTCIDSLN